jgi:AraC-like DNA-binding protein
MRDRCKIIMQETTKFWRLAQFHDLELLHAHFVTHAFSRHIHETYAIGVIQQGVEAFSYRQEKHFAPAGNVVVIHPGEVHTGYAANETGWTYRMLYPDVSLFQQAMPNGKASANVQATRSDRGIPYFKEAVIKDDYLMGLMLRLHIALEANTSQLEQDSRLLWTIAQLISRHASDRPYFQPIKQESLAIRQVREYLEAYYANNPSLEELASVVNLSPFYLLRTFRKQVGLPPHEYLNQVRLRSAKRLLSQGYAIAKVAQETGFADQSHLTRQFKRMVGVTPGVYQQSNFVQDRRDRSF